MPRVFPTNNTNADKCVQVHHCASAYEGAMYLCVCVVRGLVRVITLTGCRDANNAHGHCCMALVPMGRIIYINASGITQHPVTTRPMLRCLAGSLFRMEWKVGASQVKFPSELKPGWLHIRAIPNWLQCALRRDCSSLTSLRGCWSGVCIGPPISWCVCVCVCVCVCDCVPGDLLRLARPGMILRLLGDHATSAAGVCCGPCNGL